MTKNKKKNFKYDLSIGLIVKNEERVLKRCLESLMPLKKALDTQIIITDTGSTDGTVGIAKEYADEFIEFEWCNDFAKARNTGVEKAEGQWFLQMDADEFFDEGVMELVEFIQNKESLDYASAVFIIRNYKSKRLTTYNDSSICRLYNFTEGKKYYSYAIHEAIFVDVTKTKFLDMILHHDGYRIEVMDDKRERNAELMELELQKNPYDIRAYCLLVDCYFDPEKKAEICARGLGLEHEKRELNRTYFPYLKSLYCKALYQTSEYAKVMEVVTTFLDGEEKKTDAALEMLHVAAFASVDMHNYGDAINYLNKYLELYHELKENPDKTGALFGVYQYNNKKSFLDASLKLVEALIKSGDKEEAREKLEEFDAYSYENEAGELVEYRNYTQLISELKNYHLVAKSYHELITKSKKNDSEVIYRKKRKFMISMIEAMIEKEKNQELKESIFAYFSEEKISDGYVALNKLRFEKYDISRCDTSDIKEIEQDEFRYSQVAFSDLLYAKLECKAKFLEECNQYSFKKLLEALRTIVKRHGNAAEKLRLLLNEIDGVAPLYVMSTSAYIYLECIKEQEVNKVSERIEEIFIKYVEYTYSHIQKLYHVEEIGNNIDMLPESYAFVFEVYEAYKNRKQQPVKYMQGLRKALAYNGNLGVCVEIIAEKMKEESEQQMAANEEFRMLGEQVKMQIKLFITNNQYTEAKAILEQYEKINPRDVEIMALYELLQNR